MSDAINRERADTRAKNPSVFVLISIFLELKKKKITAREAAQQVAQECEPLFDEYLKVFTEVATTKVEDFFTFNEKNMLKNTEFEQCMERLSAELKDNIYGYINGSVTGISLIGILNQAGFGKMAQNWMNMAKDKISTLNSQQVEVTENLAISATAYIAFSLAYSILQKSLDSAQDAYEERLKMETECAEMIERIVTYRMEMEKVVSEYLVSRLDAFEDGFKAIDQALISGDSDGYLAGNKKIQEILGYQAQFSSQDEFDALMDADLDFIL